MRTVSLLAVVAALGAGILTGCGGGPTEPAAPAATTPQATAPPAGQSGATAASTSAPLGSVKVGDKAVCAICATKGETTPEEAKATLDYKGKTYAFCDINEKAEFISNPAKYAK